MWSTVLVTSALLKQNLLKSSAAMWLLSATCSYQQKQLLINLYSTCKFHLKMPLIALSNGQWSRTKGPVHSPVRFFQRPQWRGQRQLSHDYAAELRLAARDTQGEPPGWFKRPFNVQVALASLSTCPPIRISALVTSPQPSMWPRGMTLLSAVHCGLGWVLRIAYYHHIISQRKMNRVTKTFCC